MSKLSNSKMFYKFTLLNKKKKEELWLSPDDFLSFSKTEIGMAGNSTQAVELKMTTGETHYVIGRIDDFLKIWSKFMEDSGKAGE